MVFFNYALRKLNAKIVFYGPGLCGKTTNLQWIHDNFQGGEKGKMVSLATEGDRTIFFDLLPLDIGTIRGMDVTLQLYTVPGQVHYNSTRQLVLRGADGVVFVADSQRAMQSSNSESLKNLEENLKLQGFNLAEFPHILQFNKRDLGDLMSLEEMDDALNPFGAPFFEAVAVDGIGVQESLEGIVRLVMRSLKNRYEARGLGVEPSNIKPASGGGPRPLAPAPAPAPVAPAPAPGPQASTGPTPMGVVEPPPMPSVPIGEPSATERGEGAPVSDVETVAFEDVDTQTEVLVPPLLADDGDSPEFDAADRLPGGPGEPTEFDDESVAVAQYDTAEVEDLQEPVLDAGSAGDDPERELADTDLAEPAESPVIDVASEAPSGEDDAHQEELEAEPKVDGVADDSIESLVRSVVGVKGTELPPSVEHDVGQVDVSESLGGPDVFEVETTPEEIETQESAPQNEVSDFEPSGIPQAFDEPPVAFDDVPEPFDEEVSKEDAALEADAAGTVGGDEISVESDAVFVQQVHRAPAPTPVVFDEGDPFSEAEWEGATAEPSAGVAVVLAPDDDQSMVSVSAEDNSLALKLTGTGAIVESGQVRALDIEVPVPGTWVGNRRVTLQLRLTLLPITEDENDGKTGPA